MNISSLFSEEQLKELETIFGLTRVETLPVRDGVVTRDNKVWWRGEDGPEFVEASRHWVNIREYPHAYQLRKPQVKTQYLD